MKAPRYLINYFSFIDSLLISHFEVFDAGHALRLANMVARYGGYINLAI